MNRIFYQYYATFVGNLLIFIEGLSISWTSPNVPLLMSDKTPLKMGAMTQDEASLIVAVACVGGMVSTLVTGWLLDTIGRKKTLILVGIPYAIGWICIIWAENVLYLAIGRCLSGFAGTAAFMGIPVFVSEVTDDKRRGALGTVLSLGCNVGIFVGFILGANFDYYIIPIVIQITLVIFFISVYFIEESPRYLRMKGKLRKAQEAFEFYNNKAVTAHNVELNLEDDPQQEEKFKWSDMKRPDHWKPTLIAIFGAPLSISSGTFVLISYTQQIFDETGSQISSDASCIIIAFIQLVGSYVSMIAIERAGRKTLLLISTFGCGILLILCGFYYYLKNTGYDMSPINLLPLVCVSMIFFIFGVGLASVPYVVFPEILPTRLRGAVTTILVLEILTFMAIGQAVRKRSTLSAIFLKTYFFLIDFHGNR